MRNMHESNLCLSRVEDTKLLPAMVADDKGGNANAPAEDVLSGAAIASVAVSKGSIDFDACNRAKHPDWCRNCLRVQASLRSHTYLFVLASEREAG